MRRKQSSIVINRPVADIFTFVENPANDRLWRKAMLKAELTSEGPIGVGSTGREEYDRPGQRVESTWEITEYVPNEKVVYRSTSGPGDYEGTVLYEDLDGATRLTLTVDWEPNDQWQQRRMSDRMIQVLGDATLDGELAVLKRLMEA